MNKPLKICFILSLAGILILLFLSEKLEPEIKSIANITEGDINRAVKIRGEIISIKDFNDNSKILTIFTIKDKTGNITVILNSKTPLEINKSKQYIITGKVQEYNKSLEISADKIFEVE